MTDFVATIALGVISKNLEDVNNVKDKYLFEIIALQAPLLLLHLGGLDTITAYSLEDNKDNKFWLRHLLGLGVPTWVVVYIWIIQVRGKDMGTQVGK